jgi:uncharacterized protein (TIGR02231 family)
MEVTFEYHEKQTDDPTKDPSRSETLRLELAELKRKRAHLDAERKRVQSRSATLDSYVVGMLGPHKDKPPAMGFDLDAVERLFEFSRTKAEDLDTQLIGVEEALAANKSAVEEVEFVLRQLQAPAVKKSYQSRDVSVLYSLNGSMMENSEGKPPKLLLTYMVNGASWSPSYDLRVDTTTSREGELELAYLGLVKNNSEEDWSSCRVTLSTAQPSKAGMPPAPPKRILRWGSNTQAHYSRRPQAKQSNGGFPRQAMMSQAMMSSNAMMQSRDSCDASENERRYSFCAPEVTGFLHDEEPSVETPVETTSLTGGASPQFVIERLCTVEADNKPHRVTIAILHFTPQLLYFATPCLESAFYLQVKAKNTSPFPLLPSRHVSVFLDGSFVTTTSLKNVSPSEEFTTFLGVDTAIKLDYQELPRVRKDVSSWATTTKTEETSHRFSSQIHNMKSVPVQLTVVSFLCLFSPFACFLSLSLAAVSHLLSPSGLTSTPNPNPNAKSNPIANPT